MCCVRSLGATPTCSSATEPKREYFSIIRVLFFRALVECRKYFLSSFLFCFSYSWPAIGSRQCSMLTAHSRIKQEKKNLINDISRCRPKILIYRGRIGIYMRRHSFVCHHRNPLPLTILTANHTTFQLFHVC